MFRNLLKLMAAAFVTATLVTAVPTASAQQPGEVTCDLSGQAGFQPGVLFVPRLSTLTLAGNDGGCIDAAGEVRSASLHGTAIGTLSCLGSPEGTSGEGRIDWALRDGTTETSTVDFVLTGSGLAHVELAGVIADGRFAGEEFTAQFNVEIIDAGVQCVSFRGVTLAGYDGTFTVG
ncbi:MULTISPECIES: hypothetical protein [Actinoalloteichus]|uniref:Uncharacterized protein n=1 Tax=Actinoalloteichus fjordicus TaxID=1612552 RepID=A0AAC9PSH5_9PSEU|nr:MULTISPECIES: hypothetical protein [Actinoalloteichus]APU15007.1 hypothetical protein UA74_14755 [Actinoalloteichus fjordicus]APU21075.1 hypothetical protein UA75_15325 [Actinoalloteichus sp. GBA129-24]